MTHHWSGFPGGYCLRCGTECVLEYALCCPDCDLKAGPDDDATDILCAFHDAWAKATEQCPPDKTAVGGFLSQYPEMRASS